MSKKYEESISTGVGRVYYSIISGEGTYGTPKLLGDIVSFEVSPSEQSNSFWAGDRQVIVDSSVVVSGNLVVPALTNEVLCDLFGYKMSENGGVIYSDKAARPNVALLIEQHNYNNVTDYITLYKVRMQLGGKTGATKTDSITYGNVTLNYDVLLDGNCWMHVVSSDEDDYVSTYGENFFKNAPQLPSPKTPSL